MSKSVVWRVCFTHTYRHTLSLTHTHTHCVSLFCLFFIVIAFMSVFYVRADAVNSSQWDKSSNLYSVN